MSDDKSEQFKDLDKNLLIGGPLKAACEAQVSLSKAIADFITGICMNNAGDKNLKDGAADFSSGRVCSAEEKNEEVTEKVSLNVPMLGIVKIPELKVDDVNIKFDMEVKSAEAAPVTEGDSADRLKFNLDTFRTDISAKVDGSTHEGHIRDTDTSARYHIQVREGLETMPEGLAKVLDILESSVKPSVGDDNNKKRSDW